MPDVTGSDIYRFLSEARPGYEAKMAFMTGGAFTADAESFLAASNRPTVQKPYTRKSLFAVIEAVLGRSGPSTPIE